MVIEGILPFRESSHGRTGNRNRDLMITSHRLWPLDQEAGLFLKYNSVEKYNDSDVYKTGAKCEKYQYLSEKPKGTDGRECSYRMLQRQLSCPKVSLNRLQKLRLFYPLNSAVGEVAAVRRPSAVRFYSHSCLSLTHILAVTVHTWLWPCISSFSVWT